MANYQNGKIYTIRSPNTDKFYIGSTTQPLFKRFYSHKCIHNSTCSKEIFQCGDAYIELLEDYKCSSNKAPWNGVLVKRGGKGVLGKTPW
jgi:hypothetical protein